MIFKGESGLEQRISIERIEEAINIFGSFDENIRLLEQEFSVTVVNRDGELRVDGEPENTMLAVKAIGALLKLSSRGETIGEQNVRYVIGLVRSGKEEQISELTHDVLCISAKGRPINEVSKLEDAVIMIRERTEYLPVWDEAVVEWLQKRNAL